MVNYLRVENVSQLHQAQFSRCPVLAVLGFWFCFCGFFFLFFSRELAVTSVKQHRVPEAGVGEGKKEVELSLGAYQ